MLLMIGWEQARTPINEDVIMLVEDTTPHPTSQRKKHLPLLSLCLMDLWQGTLLLCFFATSTGTGKPSSLLGPVGHVPLTQFAGHQHC